MDQLEINKNLNEELESQNEDNNSLSLEYRIQEDAVPRGDVSINLSEDNNTLLLEDHIQEDEGRSGKYFGIDSFATITGYNTFKYLH